MKILRQIALVTLAIYALLQYVPITHSGLLGIAYSLISIIALIVLPSMGIAAVIELVRKKVFTSSEFLTVVSAISLFIIPFITLISLPLLPSQFMRVPLLLCAGIACILLQKREPMKIEKKEILVYIYVAATAAFIWMLCNAYYPLPDLDPYSWLSRYQAFIEGYNNGRVGLADRPGFFATLFLYNILIRIDAYALLKYVLPLLYTTSVFPLWMIAQKMRAPWKFVTITGLFWSSSTILYAITPMPQMLFISATFFAISFLFYARVTGEKFYRHMAGIVFAFCIPLYEVATVLFLVWLVVTLWHERLVVYKHFIKNPVALTLFLLLVVTNFPFLSSKVGFVLLWAQRMLGHISDSTANLLFPAYYTNIDGNQVGWSGPSGVSKYYVYYVGLPTIFIIAIGATMLIFKKWRMRGAYEVKVHPESQIISLIFILFFLLSEVLPRLINFAVLPERSWIIGGIALLYPALLFLPKLHRPISNLVACLIIFLSISGIAGATYINDQKKFLISSEQLRSAEWIQNNLPTDRIMVSDINGNLLTFYSHSHVVSTSPLFCNESYREKENFLAAITKNNEASESTKNIDQILVNIRNSILQAKPINTQDVAAVLSEYRGNMLEATPQPAPQYKKPFPYYIYYSAPNPHDPYGKRPYAKPIESCRTFVFDENPLHYERIYEHENSIIIWAIK